MPAEIVAIANSKKFSAMNKYYEKNGNKQPSQLDEME